MLTVHAWFDGVEDFDVEIFEREQLVAGVSDVVIDKEIGVDVAGMGSELAERFIIIHLP